MKIRLYNRDEIFIIDLDTVLYFKAEDHYTIVYYGKDTKQLLPFGLSQLESLIATKSGHKDDFIRAGRSHLLHYPKIIHASVSKETVTLLSGESNIATVHVSRSVVKEIANRLKNDGQQQPTEG